MSGVDLLNRVNVLTKLLYKALEEMEDYGIQRAYAEHDYRIKAKQETLKLRAAGTPATIIESIVKGDTADERLERDIADVKYRTAQERINGIKIDMNTTREQINREWGNNG